MSERGTAGNFDRVWNLLAALMIGLIVSACAAGPTAQQLASADYGQPPPERHQQIIKDWFDTRLIDPTSPLYRFDDPRRGYTKASSLHATPLQFGWVVCGAVNAKNRLGGYVGWETFFALFKDGKLVFAKSGFFAEEACRRR